MLYRFSIIFFFILFIILIYYLAILYLIIIGIIYLLPLLTFLFISLKIHRIFRNKHISVASFIVMAVLFWIYLGSPFEIFTRFTIKNEDKNVAVVSNETRFKSDLFCTAFHRIKIKNNTDISIDDIIIQINYFSRGNALIDKTIMGRKFGKTLESGETGVLYLTYDDYEPFGKIQNLKSDNDTTVSLDNNCGYYAWSRARVTEYDNADIKHTVYAVSAGIIVMSIYVFMLLPGEIERLNKPVSEAGKSGRKVLYTFSSVLSIAIILLLAVSLGKNLFFDRAAKTDGSRFEKRPVEEYEKHQEASIPDSKINIPGNLHPGMDDMEVRKLLGKPDSMGSREKGIFSCSGPRSNYQADYYWSRGLSIHYDTATHKVESFMINCGLPGSNEEFFMGTAYGIRCGMSFARIRDILGNNFSVKKDGVMNEYTYDYIWMKKGDRISCEIPHTTKIYDDGSGYRKNIVNKIYVSRGKRK